MLPSSFWRFLFPKVITFSLINLYLSISTKEAHTSAHLHQCKVSFSVGSIFIVKDSLQLHPTQTVKEDKDQEYIVKDQLPVKEEIILLELLC